MTLMNKIFQALLDKCVIIYLDDILVYSKNTEEHLQHLEQVFQILRKHQLYAKITKCDFLKKQVEFLGHVVSDKGLAVEPHKIEAIQQ